MTRKIWAKTVKRVIEPKTTEIIDLENNEYLASYKTDPDFFDLIQIIECDRGPGSKQLLVTNTDDETIVNVVLLLRISAA